MVEIDRIALLLSVPALYALYGAGDVVAYVGISGQLRRRIEQHLERNSSSVTRRDSVVILNTDNISEVRWWTAEDFPNPVILGAAEQVAFDVLRPILRSQGTMKHQSSELAADPEFQDRIRHMLMSGPTGRLMLPTLQDALDKISRLEQRISALESPRSAGLEREM